MIMVEVVLFLFLIGFGHCLIPIQVNLAYDTVYTNNVNNSVEILAYYKDEFPLVPLRITTYCANTTHHYPLMVVARQKREILSWQLPLTVISDSGGMKFYNTSRTMCSNIAAGSLSNHTIDSPIISISTASKVNVTFTLQVERQKNFYVSVGSSYNISVSPSTPQYFFYSFDQNTTNNHLYNLKTVILEVNSDDFICMTVSIQNFSCPVYDMIDQIKFQGMWQTIDRKGGITISSSQFPKGFFIVMVAHADDSDCLGYTHISSQNRTKSVTFTIKPSISFFDYVIAVVATLIVIVFFSVSFTLVMIWYWMVKYRPRAMNSFDESEADNLNEDATPSTTTAAELGDNVSMDETEYDTILEAAYDKYLILGKPIICLRDLARKDHRILTKKSYLYLWQLLTVALFYGLPVIQLVITYQNILNDTGNQDLCYYNFLCAYPLGFLSDFNHLYSNIGYVMFGTLFLFIVKRKEKQHTDLNFENNYGIPQHYGLFYALGICLIMEGILSGGYHICPNHLNFQFDSSFMYIMAVLCMIKLYHTRHPDINATANSTFGVLAITILLGMIGVLEANLYFWILFTIFHIVYCLALSVQLYYLGNWKLDKYTAKRVFRHITDDWRSGDLFIPTHKSRMVLLLIGNVLNWALAGYGVYKHEKDFARHLLAILLGNTLLYFIFYLVMKLLHKEKIILPTIVFLISMTICAASALYFFIHKSISWSLTPAESRRYNQECNMLKFYDSHDIWHFLSAAGMFFTFMVLLTLDDDLSHTHRSKIIVF